MEVCEVGLIIQSQALAKGSEATRDRKNEHSAF